MSQTAKALIDAYERKQQARRDADRMVREADAQYEQAASAFYKSQCQVDTDAHNAHDEHDAPGFDWNDGGAFAYNGFIIDIAGELDYERFGYAGAITITPIARFKDCEASEGGAA